ncbi:MAG: glyoxalase-like domain protein [SAR86 cluster bacterium]|uniref:Glyoxalase-like domain protein n=1 Tax=SAR86 cluster bacterium TaxID=2030880 RepID=A0A520N3W9_9GAMM|nr:MAG: glyoxalase-like domain protein [SAR86 cluster bacterium]
MIETLDHLIIAVQNLDEAEENYKKIFGIPPVWKGTHKELGTANVIFNFKNTYFELLSVNGDGLGADLVNNQLKENGEGMLGLVLGTEDINSTAAILKDKGFPISEVSNGEGKNSQNDEIRKWKNIFLPSELTRGIFSFIIQHTEGSLPTASNYDKSSINKLDHVVLNTNDADGFINIYRDIFNIRLALDRVIEHWKTRMLFFRLNKTTIEVIEQKNDDANPDNLWGLAWEVESIKEAHERLTNDGIEITEVKKGIKENTLVATIKSHTNNVPTLLIEHLS